jgi:arylsulfatase A-like enzyme
MKVDNMFEKLCDALKKKGEYDDSLIFFFSDHGDYTGDYGIAEKSQNTFEDCLTKVPFLVKPPKTERVDPGITDTIVELLDFYATVQDYAGLEPVHTHFGKSLRQVIEDREFGHREFACCEGGRLPDEVHCDEFHAFGPKGSNLNFHYYPRHKAQTDNEAHAKGVMIRNKDYKYISRVLGRDEFYDLKKDPKELINRIDDESYQYELTAMQQKLMKWMIETSDIVPFDYDQRFSFEMKWAKVKNYVPVENVEEIKQRIRDGHNIFLIIEECRKRFV